MEVMTMLNLKMSMKKKRWNSPKMVVNITEAIMNVTSPMRRGLAS
jgi:hypothetical protein